MVISVLVPAVSFGLPAWLQIGIFMGALALGVIVSLPKQFQRMVVALGAAFGLATVAIQAAGSYPNFVIICNDFCLNFCCWF